MTECQRNINQTLMGVQPKILKTIISIIIWRMVIRRMVIIWNWNINCTWSSDMIEFCFITVLMITRNFRAGSDIMLFYNRLQNGFIWLVLCWIHVLRWKGCINTNIFYMIRFDIGKLNNRLHLLILFASFVCILILKTTNTFDKSWCQGNKNNYHSPKQINVFLLNCWT